MGCAISRERRCRHCQAPLSPDRPMDARSRWPQQSVDGSYHVVTLKSSTLGSLNLDLLDEDRACRDDEFTASDGFPHAVFENLGSYQKQKVSIRDGDRIISNGRDELLKDNLSNAFSMGLIEEAKTWSNMMNEKITKVFPKTPARTPPREPEMINEWELMEGLEDEVSPFRSPNHVRSLSLEVIRSPARSPCDLPKSRFRENGSISQEPVCSGGTATEFDPEIIALFRKSLQELSPDHPFHTHSSNSQEDESTDCETQKSTETVETEEEPGFFSKKKVVLYFTSLRGVRKTYEDCCHVRVILKGIGVRVDERDVSMHSGFKDEIAELLGDGIYRGGLPIVFLGRKHIGGADEVKRMHDGGELEKAFKGCEKADDVGECGENTCEACGDVRFVPCKTCSGSRKVYYEEEEEDEVIGFQRCPDCNENGLIRCPICCY